MFSRIKRCSLAFPPPRRLSLFVLYPLGLCNPQGNQPQRPRESGRRVLSSRISIGFTARLGGMVYPLLLLIGFVIPWGGTWLGLNSIRGPQPISRQSCHAFRRPWSTPATARGTWLHGAPLVAQAPPATAGAAVARAAAGAGRGLRVLHHLEQLAPRD